MLHRGQIIRAQDLVLDKPPGRLELVLDIWLMLRGFNSSGPVWYFPDEFKSLIPRFSYERVPPPRKLGLTEALLGGHYGR